MATQAEIGVHLGISQQAVSDLIRRGVLPADGDIDQARMTYCEHLRAVAAGRGGQDNQVDLTQARARQASADADLKELDYCQRTGSVVAVAELEPQLAGWAAMARSEIENSLDRTLLEIEGAHRIEIDRASLDSLWISAFKAIAAYPDMHMLDEEQDIHDDSNQ
ncbi:MAG: hypothetical protein P8011_01610 [Acidihalobacter sp.]|uniref:hypothetical protein n=1 Tax=Acidihalobacter sp. TaxID=1872108 RepID=UPI00307EC786